MDLLSLWLTVKPLPAEAESPPVKGFGRAVHAVIFEAIRAANPVLAQTVHDASSLKPFTVSDLLGYDAQKGVEAGRVYNLRFTALTRPVAQALWAAGQEGALKAGAILQLAERGFEVTNVDWGEAEAASPWGCAMSYESLSAPWLLGRQSPSYRLAFRFISPTAFKSNEKHVPLPMPGWVFGSLLEKWNVFAPVALPPEARRFAEECMALSGFKLSSRAAYVKEGGVRVGAVGMARYTALNKDRYWLSVMNLLADFALFAGVGAGTTMGLGQCRKVSDGKGSP